MVPAGAGGVCCRVRLSTTLFEVQSQKRLCRGREGVVMLHGRRAHAVAAPELGLLPWSSGNGVLVMLGDVLSGFSWIFACSSVSRLALACRAFAAHSCPAAASAQGFWGGAARESGTLECMSERTRWLRHFLLGGIVRIFRTGRDKCRMGREGPGCASAVLLDNPCKRNLSRSLVPHCLINKLAWS